MQFTPDLLPADLVGVSIFQRASESFVFQRGPLFANIVLADEINRASPKTQSALLEAMEERQVSADGVSHMLPEPFMVIATQNPVEQEGTYRLPESQLDRFLMRLSLGYPDRAAELAIVQTHGNNTAMSELQAGRHHRRGHGPDRRRAHRAPRARTAGLHGRPCRGEPPSPGVAARTVAAGHAATVAGHPAHAPRARDANTARPTTSRRSPSRCSPTG